MTLIKLSNKAVLIKYETRLCFCRFLTSNVLKHMWVWSIGVSLRVTSDWLISATQVFKIIMTSCQGKKTFQSYYLSKIHICLLAPPSLECLNSVQLCCLKVIWVLFFFTGSSALLWHSNKEDTPERRHTGHVHHGGPDGRRGSAPFSIQQLISSP